MNQLRMVFAAFLLSMFAGVATAATIDGDNVRFTYDDTTLYGTANVVGNTIFFLPTTFRAETIDGLAQNTPPGGTDSLSATLNIQVEVITDDYLITDFVLAEQGDYFLNGTTASVTAGGRLQVTSNTKNCGLICIDSETFDVAGLTTQGATTEWSGGAAVDLANTAAWVSDTDVTAQIQNNLTATALNDDDAWIQKKAQLVGLTVTVVPIPAAAWLFLSALGAIGFTRRRVTA